MNSIHSAGRQHHQRALARTVLLFVMSLVATAYGLAHEAQPNTPSPLLQQVGFEPQLNGEIPADLQFTDEYGSQVRLSDYLGKKPVVLVPVYYTCPILCTQVVQGVAAGLRALRFDAGKDFEVVAFSFNPQDNSSEALAKKQDAIARYHRPHTAAGWHFLTGDQESIQALTRAINFRFTYDPKTRTYVHAAGIVVLTPAGRISRYFYGVEYAPRDLRLALVEASEGKTGSIIDHVLLYCYQYDPATARYGTAIMRLLRGVGVFTVVGLFTAILFFVRRERRARRALPVRGGVR
ncbi:MAG: SCO family protein [Acidobacteria bacterium]|nr:SCO family protein [Acidobacteriota bacterium]